MARPGLTPDQVVDAATDIIDGEGRVEALTLARLARELGVKTPSLYNHVAGLDDVVHRVGLQTLEELGEACRRASMGRAGTGALAAIADAYRDFALRRPGTYALTQVARPGDPVWEKATGEVLEPLLVTLGAMGIEGDDAIHAIRVLRSALHGFASLEAGGGFGLGLSVDDSFRRLVRSVIVGIEGSS